MTDGYDEKKTRRVKSEANDGSSAKRTSSKGTAKRRKKKKTSPFSRAMKKLGRRIYNTLLRLEEWTKASRKNKIITIASASAAGLLLVGGIILIIVSSANAKPKMELTLVEEQVAENYTFVDASEYAGTLLEKTDDAGLDYIEETLFVGDSNMARLVMYGLLDYSNVIGVESMGIQGVTGTPSVYFAGYDNPVTIPEAIRLMKPRRIIFNFGTNNLLGASAADFADSYGKALDKIKAAYPYADIIIMAIHPLGENRSNTALKQSQVDDYNLALIKYAKANGYPYLDTAEVLKDESGWLKAKFAYNDGIHLTDDGLKTVLSYARTHAHIVDDARPKPIGSVPTQLAPPVKETEKDFDPALAASAAQTIFISNGFTSASGHSEAPQVTWNWGWPVEGAKGGTESNVGQSLYGAYMAQNTVTKGEVLISYTKTDSEYLFTVSVYAPAAAHAHSYTWVATSTTLHTGTCADTDKKCTAKTITHAPVWGAWATDGTNCTRSCTGFQGCTVKETHTTVLSTNVTVITAATATTAGTGYKTCTVSGCGARFNVTIPATGGGTHTHTPAATWSTDATHHWHACTVSGCTEKLDNAAHTMAAGVVVAPTCTTEGHTTYTCPVCGYSENRDTVAALGHDFQFIETFAPTTEAAGYDLYRCSRCSAEEHRNEVAQLTA